MHYKLFKVKEGKLDQWKNWCNELMTTRKSEALASLTRENVQHESCYLFKENNEYFVLGTVAFSGTPKDSGKTLVDLQHDYQKKECLEPLPKETLYNLSATMS